MIFTSKIGDKMIKTKKTIFFEPPHRCPVCNGKGIVPNGFYDTTKNVWTSSSIEPITCRSCNGTGVLWYLAAPLSVPIKSSQEKCLEENKK